MISNLFTKISAFCVLMLIFLSQFVPTSYVEIKAALLGVGFASMLIQILKGKLFFLRWQLIGMSFLICCGLIFSAYGLLRGNPGAFRVLSIWLLWPMLYLVFSSLLLHPSAFKWLSRTFITSLFAVVVYGYLYLGYASGITTDSFYFELDQGQGFGLYDGHIEFKMYSVSSLLFLVPFYIHYLLEKHKSSPKYTLLLPLAFLVATLILSIVTGRKALLLILLITPFIIYFTNRYLHNIRIIRIHFSLVLGVVIAISGLAYVFNAFGLRYDAILEMFISGFEFESGDVSATERGLQFQALVEGWLNTSILFGAGNGAVASILRSYDIPWAYELTYVYLLYSTGIIGIAAFFSWYGYSLVRLRDAMRNRPDLIVYTAPMLTGSIAFCIAAATNPYLGKFDYLWIVLLPFLIAGWVKYQAVVTHK